MHLPHCSSLKVRDSGRRKQNVSATLRQWAAAALPVKGRRLKRRMATDCLVGLDDVNLFCAEEVARRQRSTEPHSVERDPALHEGLLRKVSLQRPRDDLRARAVHASMNEGSACRRKECRQAGGPGVSVQSEK
jgi:hypothetical protein